MSIFSVFALFVFLGAQLTGTKIENPPVTAKIDAPIDVLSVLKKSCFNCHSNETELSWFDHLAPISWRVSADVKRGREVMNFSEWENLSEAEKKGKLWGILNMIKAGKMPLPLYARFHPSARLDISEIETITDYVRSYDINQPNLSKKIAADSEYDYWRNEAIGTKFDRTSPNGIHYSDEFKHWKVISMANLYDNSMRVIFGNDIAVKAIEREEFHPWPEGARVVKAVWEQIEDKYGEFRPGKFINVQLMVKDNKYSNTEGWGFAKFSGVDLVPTGKLANFASKSCISCHRQLAEETGFLFNVPPKINP